MMAGPSPPIDIGPPPRFSSSSPRNQSSNLTSALQADKAALSANKPPAQPVVDEEKLTVTKQDVGSNSPATSQAEGGARPISVAGKSRRESGAAGSYMNGMSWGGISVGSWLQDDIMMSGTSPYAFQSPSFHSSSYLPKMEANFWSNLKCCDIVFSDLHELLQHFEEVHSQAPQNFPYRMSQPGSGRFSRRRSSANAANNALQPDPMRPSTQIRGFQSVTDPKLNSIPALRQSQPSEGFNRSTLSTVQDMDTLGDMEMDEIDGQLEGQDQFSFQQQSQRLSQNAPAQMTPLNTGIANMLQNSQRLQSSNPNTPLSAQPGFSRQHQHNPMVSSVNTPTFTSPQQQNRPVTDAEHSAMTADMDPAIAGRFSTNNLPFNAQLLQGLDSDFTNLNFGGPNDMLDLCIDDPAKALFSEQGDLNSQQFPQFNFSNGSANDTEAMKRLRAQQLAAAGGMNGKIKLPNEEERPYKCPVIGCEKAYKNANGLRYHEKHGHSSQKLKENGDGTFSIVNPVTSEPYPGNMGMEKEKPYRCEVCGKRYKNLNGLKYHRNHSPPCNPEFNFNNVALPGMAPNMNGEAMF